MDLVLEFLGVVFNVVFLLSIFEYLTRPGGLL